MGWWNSVIDGISSGASWAINNAGTIGQAVNAAKTVAGALALTEGKDPAEFLDDDSDPIVSFVANVNKANTHLLNLTDGLVPDDKDASVGKDVNSNSTKFSCIWKNPAPLLADGSPDPNLYQDLTKWLTLSKVPSTFTDAAGTQKDTAMAMGTALFADQPVPPPTNQLPKTIEDANSIIRQPTVTLNNQDKSLVLNACHAYYGLPLGKASSDLAWHGAFKIKVTTTSAFRQAYKAERSKLVITNTPKVAVSASTVWLVTLNVIWATAPLAIKAFPIFLDIWNKQYGTYVIVLNTTTGSIQTIKVSAPDGTITPAQIRAAVDSVAKTATEQMQNGPQNDAQNGVTQPPEVDVESSTLIVPSSTT